MLFEPDRPLVSGLLQKAKTTGRREGNMDSRRPKYAAVGNARGKERAAPAEGETQQSWGSDTRSFVDAQFATMRVRAAQRRAEKDIKKAEYHAEQDAADAVDRALYIVDRAD